MKYFLIFIMLCTVSSDLTEISDIRNSYRFAKDSEENTESFFQLTQKTDYDKDAVLSAYYGCALTLKAAYSKKVGDKVSYFKKGKKRIEAAINSEPENIELRMIRLSVQSTAPKIVRYRSNIENDKAFIIENADNITSKELKEFMKAFISNSGFFD